MKNYPKVIGFVPAFNATIFIEKTLDALSAQNYPNFEIWVCDDASTDTTAEICKSYCEKDKRFKFTRNEKNLGWLKTSEILWMEVSKISDYCFINPHDDHPYPNYISELVEILEQNPNAGIAIPGMESEYSNQTKISFYTEASGNMEIVERTLILAHRNINFWWAAYHGLHRSEIVKTIYPIAPLQFGEKEFSVDLLSIIKMGFYSYFLTSDKVLLKKVYRKKTVSSGWKHGIKNRAALWQAIFREINKSQMSGITKRRIYLGVFSLGLRKIKNRMNFLLK